MKNLSSVDKERSGVALGTRVSFTFSYEKSSLRLGFFVRIGMRSAVKIIVC
jgi:hypothetical protein